MARVLNRERMIVDEDTGVVVDDYAAAEPGTCGKWQWNPMTPKRDEKTRRLVEQALELCRRARIPSCRDVVWLAEKIAKVTGQKNVDVARAAVLYVLRRMGVPLDEALERAGVDESEYYRLIGLASRVAPVRFPVYPEAARLIDLNAMDGSSRLLAMRIAKTLLDSGCTMRGRTLAAVALFIAERLLGYDVSPPKVAERLGTSYATLYTALRRITVVVDGSKQSPLNIKPARVVKGVRWRGRCVLEVERG